MKNAAPLLVAVVLALVVSARAEQTQGAPAAAPIAGDSSGQAFRLEGAGMVQQGAAASFGAEGAAQDDVKFIGGPETQAGDPNAGDEPVQRIASTSNDTFRSRFSISAPPKAETSPIVEKAREFMRNPPYNPNNGSRDWTGWCLGFVVTTLRAVGKSPPQMAQPAAKNAYYAMADAGRISRNFGSVPAGAPLLWSGCSQWGHAAIATGEMSADGTPIMITTSRKGIREMSTKQFGCGMPTGWGKL